MIHDLFYDVFYFGQTLPFLMVKDGLLLRSASDSCTVIESMADDSCRVIENLHDWWQV